MKIHKEIIHDETRVILTSHRGVALVVFNKTDYVKKAKKLLEDG